MVSKARLDFPEPESPVMQIRRFRGRRTVMSFRLCSRAPCTTSSSAAIKTAIVPGERAFGKGLVRPGSESARDEPVDLPRPGDAVDLELAGDDGAVAEQPAEERLLDLD